ncbi:hypothetical protein NSA50_14410 [Clostridium sp. DSM 100503]|nr:hypothetical protein [Clostridium sp. DSM 100503]MCR1952226.1 hypothetical protein [Clostridium sp. DSM 100503]
MSEWIIYMVENEVNKMRSKHKMYDSDMIRLFDYLVIDMNLIC